jgi:group I intron endonuclease
MNNDTGVYAIISPSGKQYIGSAVSFRVRWNYHRSQLRRGLHHNASLQRAWNKYGEDSFEFKKIALCPVTDLLIVEQDRIDQLSPAYNICRIAGNSSGRRLSEESKKKISDKNRGRTLSAEHRAAISLAGVGRRHTVKARAAIGAAHLGLIHSEEAKKKMSLAVFGKYVGEKNPMYGRSGELAPNWGKTHGSAAREKMSARQRGEKNHMYGRRGDASPGAVAILCVETGEIFGSGISVVEWLKSIGYAKASRGSICSACSGKQKSAYGYTWRYADS